MDSRKFAAKKEKKSREEYDPKWVEQQSANSDLSESEFIVILDDLEDTKKITREKSR